MPRDFDISYDAPIDQVPRVPVGKMWPIPVHRRLEQLVDVARADGERTSATELLAAIVYAFEATPENITSALRAYRTSTAGEHLIDRGGGDVLRFKKRAQGRPVGR